jgi:RNA polymerase sigma-32 factor
MARRPKATKTPKPREPEEQPEEQEDQEDQDDHALPGDNDSRDASSREFLDPELSELDRPETALGARLEKNTESTAERGLTHLRDPVQRFVNETRRYPRLTEQEEHALLQSVRERGDIEAARKLVIHNLRLVVSIAYQYRRAWLNMLDLFQEGSVGLMEAVKRWEPAFGTRFGSYAAYWIRAHILRFLMTSAKLVHVGNTRAGRKLFFRLEKERQKLLAAGFVEPTTKLLAAALDVSEQDVTEVSAHLAARDVPFENCSVSQPSWSRANDQIGNLRSQRRNPMPA